MRSWSKRKAVGAWRWWLAILICSSVACAPVLRIRHQDPSTKKVTVQINGKSEGTLKYGQERGFSLGEGVYRLQVLALPGNTNKWSDDGQPWEFFLDQCVEITLLPVLSMGEGEWDLFFQDLDPLVVPEEEKRRQRVDKKKKNKTNKTKKP